MVIRLTLLSDENNSISAVLQSPSVRCPLCRKATDFDDNESIDTLPRNFHIGNILALVHAQEAERNATAPPIAASAPPQAFVLIPPPTLLSFLSRISMSGKGLTGAK